MVTIEMELGPQLYISEVHGLVANLTEQGYEQRLAAEDCQEI